MSDTTATIQAALDAAATDNVIKPDSTDGTQATTTAAAPEPIKDEPAIDPLLQSWVRRELDMVARGLTEEERIAANP